MIEVYVSVILLSSLSIITTLIGIGLALLFKHSKKGIAVGIGFSAGIMLSISFLELIPESINASGTTATIISLILGVSLIGILNFILPHTHFIKEKGIIDPKLLKSAYLIVLGLILHDFPEGFAMANSYIYSPSLGVLIALAIAIHNIPEEFAMAIPLISVKQRSKLFKAGFFSALAEPLGAIIGLIIVGIIPGLNALFMSFAAGAMIFISLHELLPMATKYKRTSLFILGIVLSLFVYSGLTLLIPE
jgi:ZIP family zinc transporter